MITCEGGVAIIWKYTCPKLSLNEEINNQVCLSISLDPCYPMFGELFPNKSVFFQDKAAPIHTTNFVIEWRK